MIPTIVWRYELGKRGDAMLRWVVARLPRRYGDTVVPELTAMDALARWDDPDAH